MAAPWVPWDGKKSWTGCWHKEGCWWRLVSLVLTFRRDQKLAVAEQWSKTDVGAEGVAAEWDGKKDWTGTRFTDGRRWRLLTAVVTWPEGADAVPKVEETWIPRSRKPKKSKKGGKKVSRNTGKKRPACE